MKINRTPQKIKEYAAARRQKKKWLTALTCLAAVAAFCTTCMLVMPALTLEADQTLACTYEVHQHDDSCLDEEGNAACGCADYAVHTHDPAYCCDADGNLVCQLRELETHEHDSTCYAEESVLVCEETESSGAHQHSGNCYETRSVLTCDKQEVILHTHTESCYENILDDAGEVLGQTLICGLLQVEEHQHDTDCLAAPETTDEDMNAAGLSDEEQTQADEVTARIEALPFYGELSNILAAYDEAEDRDGRDEYLTQIQRQVADVAAVYSALTEKQQAAVPNADKLMELVKALLPNSAASAGVETDGNGAALAYIDGFSIGTLLDGSEPFDKTGDLVNGSIGSINTPGNDSGDENRVVRSFDSIEYDMKFNIAAGDSDTTLTSAQIGFELSLYKGATAAEFNTKDMSWLEDGWLIEYLDADNNIILVKDSTGLYEWDSQTNAKGNKTSLNSFVNGSDNADNNAYLVNNGIVQQKLTGTYTIKNETGLASAEQSLTAFINVLAASNGEIFEPSFKLWIVGNKENLNAAGQTSTVNEIKVKKDNPDTSQYVVTVSAAARYNVLVKNSGATNHIGYFDFSTGKKADASSTTAAYGRMLSWGITLQLYNETDSEKEGDLVSKGYRGIELPVNGIAFDLTLTSSVKSGNGGSELTENYNFSPYLWDYHANDSANSGTWSRNLFWGNNDRTRYAKSVAPYNNSNAAASSYGNGTQFCYRGGTWTLTGYTVNGSQNDGTVKTDLSSAAGTGSGTVYRFSVSGYDFDFDHFLTQFPTAASGDSGNASFLSAPAFSFSAGHVQVFQRFDETYQGEFTAYVNAEASNLQARSKTHSAPTEVNIRDNSEQLSVVKYSKGSYAKYISLTDREANDGASGANKFNFSSSTYFLGGSNLETRSDDASAYAGSDIYMFSRGYRTSGDGYINAINFLQKFDSKVLSIDTGVTDANLHPNYGTADENQRWFAWFVGFANNTANDEGKNPGTATWLYAADPLWPEGYDTNSTEIRRFTKNGVTYDYTPAQRMAFAQEEDLIYFESLDQLKGAGYTCIGVLMEVRNCSLSAGSNNPTMRVAMKVSDAAANIGKTVGTTAIIRNWLDDGGSMSSISWKNGSKNKTPATEGGQPVANTLTAGDGTELKALTTYGTCVALTQGSGPEAEKLYVKSEYDNGNIVTGTHYNGYTWGMSVLVIGYKSYLEIGVKNILDETESSGVGNEVFQIDKGEWTAEYTISKIHTEATEDSSQPSTTNLKLAVTVPKESSIGADDGLTMVTSSFKIKTADGEGNPAYTDIGIGEDKAAAFKFTQEGTAYTCSAYVEFGSEGQAFIYLKNVPIGVNLPDIVFDAEIGAKVKNNADLTVSAAISGDQDTRAQTADNGNYVTETVRISTLSGSSLVKKVEEALIELDGEIHYTIAYSNTSSNEAIGKMYLYDLRPYNGDIRSSDFDGTAEATEISAYLSDANGNTGGVEFTAYARFYYSTVEPEILKRILGQKDFDNLPDTNGIYLQALLDNALVDGEGNVYFFLDENGKICDLYQYAHTDENNEQIIGANFTVNNSTRRVDTITVGYTEFVQVSGVTVDAAGDITLTPANTATEFKPNTYKKMFRHYGYIDQTTPSTITPGVGANDSVEFDSATCIFARVINLSPSKTLNIAITMKTEGNAAGDIYGNKAHSMIVGNQTSQLSSNTVKTRAASRKISGVVWHDRNLNGIQDAGEPLLKDVTATLFRYDKEQEQYVVCGENVTGAPLDTCKTNEKGEYSFGKLAEGTYIVAFSGEDLKKYTGAAAYQTGTDNTISNDGAAIAGLTADGIDTSKYAYYIKYSAESDAIPLHSLGDIVKLQLVNGEEAVEHQDLGLVLSGPELPVTGGSGTAGYTLGGLSLMAGAALWLALRRKHSAV